MNALEPPDDTRLQLAAEKCVESDELTQRALDWAATHAWQHATLVDTIVDTYLESPEFDTWVEDVAAGDDTA